MKDMLDFLDKLYESKPIRNKVYESILRKVTRYCEYGKSFYVRHFDMFIDGHVHDVLENLHSIREKIVKTPSNYGKYTDLKLSEDGVEEYADSLIEYFPRLYSSIYFLYFNGSDLHCSGIKGGMWSKHKCNDVTDHNYLGQWLTDKIDKDSSAQLIKRGFTVEDLRDTTGQEVANTIWPAVSNYHGGSLQSALVSMIFLGPWHEAKTGHSLLFLNEFCLNVTNDRLKSHFNNKYGAERFEKFQDICYGLKRRLEAFANGTTMDMSPLCRYNGSFYSEVFKNDAFDAYIEWMETNIPHIKESMEKMFKEAASWKLTNLVNTTTAGPFKYGFVFKDGWDESTLVTKLADPTRELTTHWYSIAHFLTEIKAQNESPGTALRTRPSSDNTVVEDCAADAAKPKGSGNSSSATISSSIACFSTLGLLVSMI